MKPPYVFLSAMALVAAFSSGCASDEADVSGAKEDDVTAAKRAQMNDVSVLFPIVEKPTELALHLAPSSAGRGGPLLKESLYNTAIPAQGTGGPDIGATRFPLTITYANMRAVAFRLDPCFAQVGPITSPATCDNQLRIIFQPLSDSGGSVGVTDAAVHAFYTLTRAELKSVIGEITALRVANAGTKNLGPLAVHPVVKQQGMKGKMAQGLNAIVLKYAGAANLKSFTVFRVLNGGFSWVFEGFDLKNGSLVRKLLPTLPTDARSVSFASGGSSEPSTLSGEFFPPTSAPAADNMQLLANVANAEAATPAARQAAFDAALRIQNPNFHSPNTIDCASCHVAEAATEMAKGKFHLTASKKSYVFSPDGAFVTAANAARTTKFNPNASTLNLHIFSYGGGGAMIGARAVNETASVVAYVNGTVLK